ncbi:MAG: hypothetical protein U9Q15_04825, partial [Patescibacteria group bacterium]|nr:hypothetical protein [Patescibacteria group bacterium]
SNMSSISYQLVSHNTEYSNNVFQVLPNADFTVTETDGWDISFDGSVLEYDPYTHSYRNTESKTIVQVLEEGSSFDTKPVLRFEKR